MHNNSQKGLHFDGTLKIVGCIKINPDNIERFGWLIASANSYISAGITGNVCVDTTDDCFAQINEKVPGINWIKYDNRTDYAGNIYRALPDTKWVINFEEDHFFIPENLLEIKKLLQTCNNYSVDVIRASFHKVENKCASQVKCMHENDLCRIFVMDENNFLLFQNIYTRFFMGTNCIFNIHFFNKIYGSKNGKKPHDFEIQKFERDKEYVCCVPKIEIMAPIDDDHGEDGTALINRALKPDKYKKTIKWNA